jgi:hypothetical protein
MLWCEHFIDLVFHSISGRGRSQEPGAGSDRKEPLFIIALAVWMFNIQD